MFTTSDGTFSLFSVCSRPSSPFPFEKGAPICQVKCHRSQIFLRIAVSVTSETGRRVFRFFGGVKRSSLSLQETVLTGFILDLSVFNRTSP